MPTVVITGANRGIGFHITQAFAADPANKVIATTRKFENAKQLEELKKPNIHVIELDVAASEEDVKKYVVKIDEIAPEGVDVVIHNAGVAVDPQLGDSELSHETASIGSYQKNLDINLLGSIKFYQAIFPYWAKDTGNQKKFIYVSTAIGLTNNFAGLVNYGYGTSKAALNYFVRESSFAHTQSETETIKNSISVAISPGLVLTDMSAPLIKGQNMPESSYLSPEKASGQIKTLIDGLKHEDNGTFEANGTWEDMHAGFVKVSW